MRARVPQNNRDTARSAFALLARQRVTLMLSLILIFEVLPYLEEFVRTLRYRARQ
jgi:hypothetical protein